MKNSTTRTMLLLLALMVFFNVAAFADSLTTFHLRIEDSATGMGRVVTDNVKLGLGNANGDQDAPTLSGSASTQIAGTIYFAGYVGNAFVTVYATSGNDGAGGGTLRLSAKVQYTTAAGGTVKISLWDSNFAVPPTPTLTFAGTLGGYDATNKVVTQTGTFTGPVSSATFQTWINTANQTPDFSGNIGAAALGSGALATAVSIPVGSVGALSGTPVVATGFSETGNAGSGPFGPTYYSIMSQASITFSGMGVADFTVTGSDSAAAQQTSVPEPTSLLLLGAGLAGLGFVRRRKK